MTLSVTDPLHHLLQTTWSLFAHVSWQATFLGGLRNFDALQVTLVAYGTEPGWRDLHALVQLPGKWNNQQRR